jgi:hypothetical protein
VTDPNYLDGKLFGVRTIQVDGVEQVERSIVNFKHGPAGTDNPTTGATELDWGSISSTDSARITLSPLDNGVSDDAPQIAAAVASGKIVILAAGTWVRGAVTRTSTHAVMHDPSSGVHNVEFYGALGTGLVDDTAAIQAAIDAAYATTGKVHIPTGKYLITATLNVHHGGIEIYGDGWTCNVQARYATAGAVYDFWTPCRDGLTGIGGLTGTMLWFDTCDGFTRESGPDPVDSGLILRDFACVSKSGSGDKKMIGWGTKLVAIVSTQYHDIGAFRWSVAFDMSCQYHGAYYSCTARGCVEAWRSGAHDGEPVASSGNENTVSGADIDSCERGVALYECGRLCVDGFLFQNGKHMLYINANGDNVIIGITMRNGWHETAVADNRLMYVDYTDAHAGDPRSCSHITLEDIHVNRADPLNVTPFEFINDVGWGGVLGLTLRRLYDATGEYSVPMTCNPLVVEQIRCEDFASLASAVTMTQVSVNTAAARLGDLGLRTWNTAAPAESTGGSWMVGKKITHADSPYLITYRDSLLLADTTGGVVVFTLDAVAEANGRHISIVDWARNASVNAITIDARVAETVDGLATINLVVDGSAAHLYCDGLEHRTIPHV